MLELRHERMNDVFEKWHIIGLPFDAAFHRFTGLEHGPPHSHPWSFRSFILHGGYVEETFDVVTGASTTLHHKPNDVVVNTADHDHRIIALPAGDCLTLILPGPHEREPGFYDFREDGVWHRFHFEQEFTKR